MSVSCTKNVLLNSTAAKLLRSRLFSSAAKCPENSATFNPWRVESSQMPSSALCEAVGNKVNIEKDKFPVQRRVPQSSHVSPMPKYIKIAQDSSNK